MINGILSSDESIKFSKITQEENVGSTGMARFADGKLYSRDNLRKITSFELKNSKWDATDDALVIDAATKAMNKGYEYFVTGTPRQLVIYKTFEEGVPLTERKLKIYYLSNVRNDDDVLTQSYETEVTPKLQTFLADLSDLVHGIKDVHWDSIDRFFVNKLSAYILEASAEMLSPMFQKITTNKKFRDGLKAYLQSQEIFNVSLNFDREDIYRICQLSNYLLYLKVIFYSYLQRDVPSLKLKPLEIPEDKYLLNKVLRRRFDDVLNHDFELIFTKTILDDFEFNANYIPVFKHNIEQIKNLDFKQLTADIVGSIYNTLIDNQEQHDRGQHFTNTNEVDIVNAFCIRENTKFVLDSGCGAGTFLVRAYFFLKFFHPTLSHQELLERVWGVEIAPFPAFLAVMNLSLLDIKTEDNYPVIIQSDFSKINGASSYRGFFLNASKSFEVKSLGERTCEVHIPTFDVCVGNPPYIRQELIEEKTDWTNLAKVEFGIERVNQQSDLYVYFLIHTAAFLREGGRLGYVISSSWLDVSFGTGLQKFLLDHFKIIAIIDHQKTRSFETALINTVILILEKCSDEAERYGNDVKFVRVSSDYQKLIGKSNDPDRIGTVLEFADHIENTNATVSGDDFSVEVLNQHALELMSTFNDEYSNGYWGAKFLRSPDIYRKIVSKFGSSVVPLDEIAEVKYGIKTGANDFFYLVDDTEIAKRFGDADYKLVFGISKSKQDEFWKVYGWYLSALTGEHFIIEREYIRSVYKSQKEAQNLDVNESKLKFCVLYCGETKGDLIRKDKKVLKYINVGETRPYELQNRPSVSGRNLWYDIRSIAVLGDFIFPSKIGERFRLIDNRNSQVFCDKVNYVIRLNPEYQRFGDLVFLYLNSTLFRYMLDLFARQMVVKVSDVDVNLVEKTMVLKPEILARHEQQLGSLYKSLKAREQGTIYQEVREADRRELDRIIFSELGLADADLDSLYVEACKYVKDREKKFESLGNFKSKRKITYEDSLQLISERFSDVRKYKELIKGAKVIAFAVPEGKADYPKNGVSNPNLFGAYPLYFKDSRSLKPLEFSSPEQFELFEFLNRTLGVNNQSIKLPDDADSCRRVLKKLGDDFKNNEKQVKLFLKSNRSSANHLSIYRDLILG